MTLTADRYRRFAREAAPRSPLYARWATEIADDEELLGLIDTLPVSDRQPVLILTAARFSGLTIHGDVRTWLEGEWDAVADIARRRATQTNDPRRSSALLAALADVEGPIALIEVGASAGLGLLADRYSHRFVGKTPAGSTDGGDAVTELHPHDGASTLTLTCTLDAGVPAPARMPDIVWRAGLDRRPVRLGDAEDERWLRTLIWPEERERAHHLDAALAIAHEHPPRVVAGDAVDGLRALLQEAPEGVTRVIWSPAVLVYLAPEARDRFATLAQELADVWVSLDGRRVLPELGARADETLPGEESDFLLSRDAHPLAIVSPHGDRIERWAAGATPAADYGSA